MSDVMKNAKELIRKISHKFGVDVRRYPPAPLEKEVISLRPKDRFAGNALLSYISEPFLLKAGKPISNAHTHDWESYQIARTFFDIGYSVDVVDYRNEAFVPLRPYSVFVGARTNFERIARLLDPNCTKIVHLDTAHWIFNNSASYKRLLDLQMRKGVTIPVTSLRQVESNLAIENADYATLLGNEFTVGTYRYAHKPLFPMPISTCAMYPWPEDKDFDSCRRNFLWFGSGGLVHKGLDLVLDLFAEMKECHLYVCGPIQQEKEFDRLYHRELYETPNIHTIGWVDVNSSEFTEITNKCIGLIYPSSSEGQCGAVINCLHAGLIPIISYQSGVDISDFGLILRDCSPEAIKDSLQRISGLPAEELRSMARKAWEFARANHTRERFGEAYKKVITQIVEVQRNRNKIAQRE
ncbi:MAG: glycosyltransferase [Thermodesulfovibrionales bacterium]